MTETAAISAAERISAPGVYGEILDFLNNEADLLDTDRHHEWLDLLSDDVVYRMPVRLSTYRKDGEEFDTNSLYFDDDRLSLAMRVTRNVDVVNAFDRDPTPKVRRMITNVIVRQATTADEYEVTSSFLLLRTRFSTAPYDMLSGRREDMIRRTDDGLRLARRIAYPDQTRLQAPFFNVFV